MAANPFLSVLRGEEPERIPVWFMRQAGRYMPEYQKIREGKSILEICENPDLVSEITRQPVNILGVDAAIIFSDIMLPLDAMGFDISFVNGTGPVVGNSILSQPDLGRITHFEEKNFRYPLKKSIAAFRKNSPGVPLIGFTGGPLTLLSYVVKGSADRDLEVTRNLMNTRHDTFYESLELISDMVVSYAKMQVDAGVDAIQVFDSWAGALSPYMFEHYIETSLQRVVDEIKDTKIPVIYFGTGLSGVLDQLTGLNFDVLSMDWRIRLSRAMQLTKGKFILQGNLDPRVAATPDYIQETSDIMEDMGNQEGFIFNLGHGVLPFTPPENLRSIVNYVHAYR